MILKYFETNKINLNKNKLILFHGRNEGLKFQSIRKLLNDKQKNFSYEEKEVLENIENFKEMIINKSLFESEKTLIIKRATEKLIKFIDEIKNKNLDGVVLIINSEYLDKKSKLRSLFEKDKNCISIAFYPDNTETLSKLAYEFFQKKKLHISQSNINLIVSRCNEDREKLINELKKIEFFSKNGKQLNSENISKLANISENRNISELIDNCLAKNKKKTIYMLNENNFTSEDCILITRIFLNKAKKILVLSSEFEKNRNIDLTLSKAKPPIFWKEKEITKKQIYKWKPEDIKKLINKIHNLEFNVKKNFFNSIHLVSDFLIEQCSLETNN